MEGNKPKEKELKNNEKSKKKKRLGWFGKTILILLFIILMIVTSLYMYIHNKIGKVQSEEINEEELSISETTNNNLAKYRNIALFGVDARADTYSKGNRSDCIIIASINNETKEVKLISVYRDTYSHIEGHGLDKITHAYSYGEAPLAIKTLNENLDLNIKEFVAVNFESVKEIIDTIGGVSINITSEEVKFIPGINKPGTYNLTGEQALAYARIRYATGGDYKRTERMRDILIAASNKVRNLNIGQLNNLVDKILPRVYTNLRASDIFSLLPSATSFKVTKSMGWPYETRGMTMDRWYGIPVTLESNVERLHKEEFGEIDYVPSDRVKEISNQIIKKTGYNK